LYLLVNWLVVLLCVRWRVPHLPAS
jgi:hypothetical protein